MASKKNLSGPIQQTLLFIVLGGLSSAVEANGTSSGKTSLLPSFPGAEGWGALSEGGRGGTVYRVTSLEDDGNMDGTLRYAINQEGARVVVFDVCGYIDLQKKLKIDKSNITIAGQTAPGQGITLRRFPLIIETDDVIVRHIRVRPGARNDDMDAISIKAANNVILDHVSATWGNDEAVSVTQNSSNVTIQWSIIGATQRVKDHSKGSILTSDYSGGNGGLTLHHNFYTSCDDRMPKFGTSNDWGEGKKTRVDFKNNIVFNWGKKNSGRSGDNQKVQVNYINNWLQPGNNTDYDIRKYAFTKTTDRLRLYIDGNFLMGSLKKDQKDLVKNVNNTFKNNPFSEAPIQVTLQDADDAADAVVNQVGALYFNRDEIDQEMLVQLFVPNENGGEIPDKIRSSDYCDLDCPNNYSPPSDDDMDGIPDIWEMNHGSDPNTPDGDAFSSSGYTFLEDYLNSLCD